MGGAPFRFLSPPARRRERSEEPHRGDECGGA